MEKKEAMYINKQTFLIIFTSMNKTYTVGLSTFVVITPWYLHLGAETCRSLCHMCCMTKCVCRIKYWLKEHAR